MNRNNNTYNEKEVKNKLKDFKEGQDYSVSPTDEPNIKTYNFHNDKLRSMFRDDRVPVRITQEAYDGKDYTYRGHFEEGKDYYYGRKDWYYGDSYQGDYGEGINVGNDSFFENAFGSSWAINSGIKWDEHSVIVGKGEAGNFHTGEKYWEASWTYRGKGNKNNEPKQIEPNLNDGYFLPGPPNRNYVEDFKRQCKDYEEKLRFWEAQPISYFEERGWSKEGKICNLKEKIINLRSKIEHEENYHSAGNDCCESHDEKDNNHSYLRQENQELRQQLAEVQKQLTEVLEELKKLKSNINGKDSEKLEQQIVQNEKLIKDSENVSVAEVKEQVNKSQALMNEINTSVSPKDNKGNGSLPYVIGGSVILASAGIIGYFLVKRNKRK